MTSEELELLLREIVTNLSATADLVGVIDPALIPAIIMGKALGAVVPGLGAMIQRWVEGNPPTQQELDDIRAKLAVLSDPNNP